MRVGQIPCWSGSSRKRQRAPFPIPAQDLFRAVGSLFSVFVRPVKARVFLVQHRLIFDLSATSVFFAVPAGHFSLIPTAPNQFFLASNWVPLAFPTDFQISDFILDFAVLGLGSRALLISCFAGGPVHREITARQHF
jgi:hypothetical protein